MALTVKAEDELIGRPSLAEAIAIWAKIGLLSFGGPAAQIALMYREIVAEKAWLTERQYLNALNFCMLLPGPEAMQLATYAGWRLHGWMGGLAAGLLFIAPGAVIMLLLSLMYSLLSTEPFVGAVFFGIKAAIVVIVVDALLRLSKRALHTSMHYLIAVLAFVGLFCFALPYPLIIMAAAVVGFFYYAKPAEVDITASPLGCSLWRTLGVAVLGLGIWFLPLYAVSSIVAAPILGDISLFFSKLAVVTFGGAYSVLSYMAQDVVSQYQWLSAAEMLDGLGLAETTPGPLILVTEFVGFLAAYHQGGVSLGLIAAALTLWATFVPCFLWIFMGAPYIEWICAQPRLQSTLSAITAAVVGVIFNLSIWFALHVFFAEVTLERMGALVLWQPQWDSVNIWSIILALICGVLLFRFKWGILRIILSAAILGVVASLL
jgi:chromate transporter